MPKSKRVKPVFEKLDYKDHPEFEIKETRVSDYLRRYGTGHIEDLPQTKAPEIVDDRTPEEMVNDEFVPHMSTESVDILAVIDENRERFQKAFDTIQLSKTARKKYVDAMSVIDNPNASIDAKREAYSVLDSLIENGFARARK